MKQKQNNAHHASTKADLLKSLIMDLLQWDELTFGYFQYNQGLIYLETYVSDSYALEHSRIFWNWWKNHWTLRDEDLIARNIEVLPLDDRRAVYGDYHNGKYLAHQVHPNRVVLEQSYATMITEAINSAQKPT
jgi:hypothetical protein